ncbi:uncharacterized protein N7459_001988 [Penicillium hispanicum]|uniref:uncharacterized protein n=1 Tax=Penicillium hispanicum TaxID=1080232 RepID=UPI00253FE727|nr:uncharacterized protein N7459_001988 [Penicillium hispanicum]KAJ5591619.1 hypothetical protein N7459_001988 [Penicillium hispanicum]
MLCPGIANLVQSFYPVGNTPAVSLTQHLPAGEKADILLLGCGDLRHVLFTIHSERVTRKQAKARQLDVTCCDVVSEVIARDILLLSLILDDKDGSLEDTTWDLFFHFRIPDQSLKLLQAQANKLVSTSSSIQSWNSSKYGERIRLADESSLKKVRDAWAFYKREREGEELRDFNSKAELSIMKSLGFQNSTLGEVPNLTAIRSAGPACLDAALSVGDLFKDYWKYGTTAMDPPTRLQAIHFNPMFIAQDDIMALHYGLDPLLGFHLVTCYAPITPASELHVQLPKDIQGDGLVQTAQNEFKCWMRSFRSRFATNSVILRFFTGDAMAFAYTLQERRMPQSPTCAHWYRDRYHYEPLSLNEQDYSGGTAPLLFNVIDTSNLGDHIGPLNILTATSPLLRNELSAVLYTEKLVRTQDQHQKLLDNLLCGDPATISSLLGLVPVDVATNTSSWSAGDELSYTTKSIRDTSHGQLFVRVPWKRPVHVGEQQKETLDLIHFESRSLAGVLYSVFLEMFEEEDLARLLAKTMGNKGRKGGLPTYSRASFAAFLRLVKTRVSVDWTGCMEALLDRMKKETGLAFAYHYYQELMVWLHILDIFTVDTLQAPLGHISLNCGSTGDVREWKDIPPVVAITLQVPRKNLDLLICSALEQNVTPPIQAFIQASPQVRLQAQNMFAAVQMGFGSLRTKGTRHTDSFEVVIDEDDQGWNGNSPMLFSFLVPAWILVRDPREAVIALAIMPSAGRASFATSLGPGFSIFSTTLQDSKHVYIARHLPHQHEAMSICGFLSRDVTDAENPGVSKTLITAAVKQISNRVMSFTSHVDILSEEAKAALKRGSPVTRSSQSPLNYTLSLQNGSKFAVSFPVPVLESSMKTRVTRKSSYLEIMAHVVQQTNWSAVQSFMYPVFPRSQSLKPLVWNLPYLEIRSLPALDLSQSSRLKWLSFHVPTLWSAREGTLRLDESLPATPGERARVEFKDSLFTIFMCVSGLREVRSQVFGIDCEEDLGIHILLFVSAIRLDLSNRTVVLDAAVLPLHTDLAARLESPLQMLTDTDPPLLGIPVDQAELKLWKEALPAWVERCRSWSHKAACQYYSRGKIPLSTETGERVLCSCGDGTVPADYVSGIPGWRKIARYTVRAAISLPFPSAMVDGAWTLDDMIAAGESTIRGIHTCGACGRWKKSDGSDLMTCSRCRTVKYCSRECQRADWKYHKPGCSDKSG